MAAVHFRGGGGDEAVDEVVGFDAEAFAAGDLNVGAALVFLGDGVAQFFGTARGKRHHLVGEVGVAIRGFGVAQAAQGFDDVGLRVGLAPIDDVIDGLRSAKVRVVGLAVLGGDPAGVVGIWKKRQIAEVAAQQPNFQR